MEGRGLGKGGDLGGLEGADAHCQALAKAEFAGDHTWRAYLSASASNGQPAVNARDRIGKGPWYKGEGTLVAADIEQLHSDKNNLNKETALTERINPVGGVGDDPNVHDILTGSPAHDARRSGGLKPSGYRLPLRRAIKPFDYRLNPSGYRLPLRRAKALRLPTGTTWRAFG